MIALKIVSKNDHLLLDLLKNQLPAPVVEGSSDAEITIITWGSTKAPVLQAIRKLSQRGIKVNVCQILYLSPFHSEEIAEIIKDAKRTVVIECNKTSQLSGIIKENTGLDVDYKILKYDGRPFYPEEIVEKVS